LRPIVGGDLQPGDALGPLRRDPVQLLTAWFVRKLSYPLIWIGVIGAVLTRRVDRSGRRRPNASDRRVAGSSSPIGS